MGVAPQDDGYVAVVELDCVDAHEELMTLRSRYWFVVEMQVREASQGVKAICAHSVGKKIYQWE